ncbi:hypothetical protein Pint_01062 [Pistacia integerrima]|uniref:Uncharacterized protein n=1 Tax=Pistacia integerrima TaxID=434235 RepID=A0ACC0ZLU4_9ROSI|nr:hypothetical protein Pint_01062 [Pistacia integerrima]
MMCSQFTRSGHTQLDGNTFMIASIITIVLFSTVERDLCPKGFKVTFYLDWWFYLKLMALQREDLSSWTSSDPMSVRCFATSSKWA